MYYSTFNHSSVMVDQISKVVFFSLAMYVAHSHCGFTMDRGYPANFLGGGVGQ